MKAQAAKPTQKAARSERAPSLLVTPVMMSPANDFVMQRKSCACGGECPRCRKKSIHTTLPISPADDSLEREADSIAERVMRAPPTRPAAVDNARPQIQRACSACTDKKEDDGKWIQRHATPPAHRSQSYAEDTAAGTIDHAALTAGGLPLTSTTRNFFESRFQRDLSGVRLHTGVSARDYCRRLDAHAFTYGSHVWLGDGVSASPSFVLAHELAHVVQQTQPTVSRVAATADAAPERGHQTNPAIQRLPFWVPLGTKLGEVMSGSDLHKELLGAVDGKNNVTVEAPVPNAIRSAWGLGLQGFADLYRASSRVGVFFDRKDGQELGDKHGNNRHDVPLRPERAGKTPKPVVKGGAIKEIAAGPTKVELGELKPAAKTELEKGHAQLGNYTEGFKDAAALTNDWALKVGKTSEKWTLGSVDRLPASAVNVAPEHDPASPTNSDRRLAIADIDEVSTAGKSKEGVKFSVRELFKPRPWFKDKDIKGKLCLEPFGQGLWMYYARPNDFNDALNATTFKRDERTHYMKTAEAVQGEVIGNLLRGPNKITLLRRSPAARMVMSPAPKAIQRKPKKTSLKDEFDLKAWDGRQSQLGKEVRGTDKTAGTTETFEKLQFLELAMRAERNIPSSAKKKTKNVPMAHELKETIETGKGKEKATKQTGTDKLFGWMERWTSPLYRILGQFRGRLGGTFVMAANKFVEIKDAIQQKLHDHFKNRAAEKKTEGLMVKALTTAIKQAVNIVVPKTLSLLFDAISTGIKKKLAKLFEDTFVEKSINDFQTWHTEIENYGNNAKAYIDKVQKDFLSKFDWIDGLLKRVWWFWSIVRSGRVILKCRRPPFLGCLELLKDAANDQELNCILCIPWVQKQLAKWVLDVPWFSNMPAQLGGLILTTMRDAVPAKAEILREIFDEKIPYSPSGVGDLVPECDTQCDGFAFFKTPGGKDITKEEAESAEKLSELKEKLSKKELEELLREADNRGMLDKPFDKQKTDELLKELEEKRKQKRAEKDKGVPPPSGAPKKAPPKGKKKEEKSSPKKSAPAPKSDPKKAPDDDSCVWSPSQIAASPLILEGTQLYVPHAPQVIIPRSVTTATAGRDPRSFNDGIRRDCKVSLNVSGGYTVGFCPRPGGFSKPTVSIEVTFEGETLFQAEDRNPKVSNDNVIPSWFNNNESSVPLLPIAKPGTLRIKMTITDPDTGTVATSDHSIKLDIYDDCCNCIM